ncbi:hypothetical protein [Ammoniphilus sp. YIM 78166]|uniref:hypothetical protein n=1 Tax=Ammoniphilus sp. YIM 78166 TaxID=1644106 RepID=UPI00106FF23C|nr:hypothetical protein [Ammoniphilus sp. YIM 78166]
MQQNKSMKFSKGNIDAQTNKAPGGQQPVESTLTITEEKVINLGSVEDAKQLRESLSRELLEIVTQVKNLKKRAEEIKEILGYLPKTGGQAGQKR